MVLFTYTQLKYLMSTGSYMQPAAYSIYKLDTVEHTVAIYTELHVPRHVCKVASRLCCQVDPHLIRSSVTPQIH